MVARFVRDEEAVGSNPATPTPLEPDVRCLNLYKSLDLISPHLGWNVFGQHRHTAMRGLVTASSQRDCKGWLIYGRRCASNIVARKPIVVIRHH